MTAATDADTKTVWLSELSGYWNLRASVDSASQGRSPRSHPFTAVPIACSHTVGIRQNCNCVYSLFSYCLCIDNASGIHLAYLVRVGGHADAEGEPAEGGVRNLQGDRQGVAHRNEVPAMRGNLLGTSRVSL